MHLGKCERIKIEANQEAVVKALFDGIGRYAAQKNFVQAEKLRDKLIDIAPMALSEIARSAEIIEQEQIQAMDAVKIEAWKNLFKGLNQSETAALYFSLKDITVKTGDVIFQQGKFDDRLFFIHSGRFLLSYYSFEKKRDMDFAVLEKGDIAGVESFFTYTNPTFTLTALQESKISYLEKKSFEKILADNPAVGSKLQSYCETFKRSHQLGNISRQARRAHQRYPTTLPGSFRRIDKSGKLAGEITSMTIADISSGGLCYIVRNLKLSDAAQLHGSWLYLVVPYQVGPVAHALKKPAKVVSVQHLPFGECSVHVRFKEVIEEKTVFKIAQYGCVNAYI